jgi:hypothetical protein
VSDTARAVLPRHRVRAVGLGWLALSALLIPLLGDFRSAYLVVPFLCWVPNLVVVEPIIRRRRPEHRSPAGLPAPQPG